MTTTTQPSHEDGGRPPSATVTVKGPGVEIVRPVDEATMANIIALLFGAAPTPVWNTPPPGGGEGGGAGGDGEGAGAGGDGNGSWDPALTLGEFLAETGASTFPQKICAIGYYLTEIKGGESFDRDAIRTALVEAREDLPGNFARDFTNAAAANLIAEKPGESGKFFVPKTGRKAVDSNFRDVPKRRAKSARKAAASKSDANE